MHSDFCIGGRAVVIGEPLPFVQAYVSKLSTNLEQRRPGSGLTRAQRAWLGFCLVGILVTQSVCWQKWVRADLGRYSEAL